MEEDMPSKRLPSTAERSLSSLGALDFPLMTFDLPTLITQMKREDSWPTAKRNAMTLLKGTELRIVLIVMQAGTAIQAHQTDSPINVQVLEGRLQLSTDSESVTLGKGQMLALQPGIRHGVESRKESAFLLTLATGQLHPVER
jgi:quercetin dioxygenase-like cupin family protein